VCARLERSIGYDSGGYEEYSLLGCDTVQSGSFLPKYRRNDSKHISDQMVSPPRKQYFVLYIFTCSLIRTEALQVEKGKSVLDWKRGGGMALTGQMSYSTLLLFGDLDLRVLSEYFFRHCPLYEYIGYF
jgi:hypothetical protein